MTRNLDNTLLFGLVLWAALAMSARACTVGPAVAAAQDDDEPSVSDEPAPEDAPIAWDDTTRLAVAQCLVAEARWRNRTEHAIMLHVLERRWRRYNRFHPHAPITFERQVRQYCHLHRSPEDSTSRWALDLPWGPLTEDVDPNVTAARWADDWDYTRETVTLFEHGALADPMPLAILWGGGMDSVGATVVYLGPHTRSIVPNTDGSFSEVLLHNRFYALRTEIAHAAARRGR